VCVSVVLVLVLQDRKGAVLRCMLTAALSSLLLLLLVVVVLWLSVHCSCGVLCVYRPGLAWPHKGGNEHEENRSVRASRKGSKQITGQIRIKRCVER
jgi:hypothetical protein